MRLPVDDYLMDDGADIVDRHIAEDLDHAGVGIDLDLADMTAVRE